MRWGRFFVPAAVAYVVMKVVLLAVLSVNTQYVMDEYAQAGYQLEDLDSLYTNYDPVKTVLYIYYYRIAVGDRSQTRTGRSPPRVATPPSSNSQSSWADIVPRDRRLWQDLANRY